MKPLSGKKVLFVICQENFRDEELAYPREEVEGAGAKAALASREKAPAKGMLGAVENPDLAIRDARASDYDAVVAVGGRGTPEYLWNDDELHRLLQEARDAGKVVGGICLSGATLAVAGVLKGVEATCYVTDASKKEMHKGGAVFVEKPVVVSGKIVTASGPPAARDFGKALVTVLSKG
ncbi:MAG TPA: DJ-1/PfpI family protein [Candidatus Deferrimicrobiaceae bacterium]|nr:DJ-1/PfpI family protein [Candidatus Deferrimicrobiaceae bacterium]